MVVLYVQILMVLQARPLWIALTLDHNVPIAEEATLYATKATEKWVIIFGPAPQENREHVLFSVMMRENQVSLLLILRHLRHPALKKGVRTRLPLFSPRIIKIFISGNVKTLATLCGKTIMAPQEKSSSLQNQNSLLLNLLF